MSRTDAHDPWWVKSLRYGSIDHNDRLHQRGECRPETREHAKQTRGRHPRRQTRAEYEAAQVCDLSVWVSWRYSLTQWTAPCQKAVRKELESVARSAARASLDQARDEFNTWGETDVEPTPIRHRSSAAWICS